MKVKDLMTSDPATLGPDDVCAQAATLMREEDCGSIPVVRDSKLIGIVTDRDIVVRAIAAGKDAKTTKISEIMSADPITIAPDSDTEDAAKLMAEHQVRRLPVVDKGGRLLGLIVTAQLARREKENDMGKTIKEISEPASGRGSHGRG
ncbi:MAG TPA: CBS domain-containing protein [Candidatus Limnocylindrales bacterium]|nr:CBS domain-containing protein [Candidatus Limnocylindrales bacterium]